MRKTGSVVIFLMLSLVSKSQITQGNLLVGGNASYDRSKSSGVNAVNSRTRQLYISSNTGYFIADKLVAGLLLNARFDKQVYPQPDGSTTSFINNSYGIGPFVRYYFLNNDNKVNLLADLNGSFSLLKTTGGNTATNRFQTFDYGFFAGPVVFFNSSVGMEFLLGYRKSTAKDVDSRSQNIQFKIGFQIHLDK